MKMLNSSLYGGVPEPYVPSAFGKASQPSSPGRLSAVRSSIQSSPKGKKNLASVQDKYVDPMVKEGKRYVTKKLSEIPIKFEVTDHAHNRKNYINNIRQIQHQFGEINSMSTLQAITNKAIASERSPKLLRSGDIMSQSVLKPNGNEVLKKEIDSSFEKLNRNLIY